MSKFEFYSSDEIDGHGALYNVIFGERSNGKTSHILETILINWVEKGEQGAYLRRYDEEIKGSKGAVIFNSIVGERDLVNKYTKGEYTGITYHSRAWWLTRWDDKLNRNIRQHEPFCYAFAINTWESYKGGAYPLITTLCFDEFITRNRYIIDEFVIFQNVVSTLIRHRDNVRVYMLGNTVNKYSPYFDEMGLYNVDKMAVGDIAIYNFGEESELKVAVEYCGTNAGGKKSDKYFAFDNPKLKMITSGDWELPMYPHAPFKIENKSVIDVFFIKFRGDIIQGDIVLQDDSLFIYFHPKTTPIKDDVKQTYSLEFNPRINHSVSILRKHRNKLAAKIGELFNNDLVYYQNNNLGELVRNYIHESESRSSTNL